jgi:hypothetical protein
MMKFSYSNNIQEAMDRVSERFSMADVALFLSGGNTIPDIQK